MNYVSLNYESRRSVGGGRSPKNPGHDDCPLGRIYVIENPKGADTPPESVPVARELANVTLEGISLEVLDRGLNADPVLGNDAVKRLSGGIGEDDEATAVAVRFGGRRA